MWWEGLIGAIGGEIWQEDTVTHATLLPGELSTAKGVWNLENTPDRS